MRAETFGINPSSFVLRRYVAESPFYVVTLLVLIAAIQRH